MLESTDLKIVLHHANIYSSAGGKRRKIADASST